MGQGHSRHAIAKPNTLTEQPIVVEKPAISAQPPVTVEFTPTKTTVPVTKPASPFLALPLKNGHIAIRDIPIEQLQLLGDFDLAGLETEARVMTVYDGDTCHLAFAVSTSHLRQLRPSRNGHKCSILSNAEAEFVIDRRVRLAHIDAVEMKPNKVLGERARQVLMERLAKSENFVWVQFGKNEKWGRPLVTLFDPAETIHDYNHSINSYLTNYRDPQGDILFRKYEGGRKLD